jgi:hypothetical protein
MACLRSQPRGEVLLTARAGKKDVLSGWPWQTSALELTGCTQLGALAHNPKPPSSCIWRPLPPSFQLNHSQIERGADLLNTNSPVFHSTTGSGVIPVSQGALLASSGRPCLRAICLLEQRQYEILSNLSGAFQRRHLCPVARGPGLVEGAAQRAKVLMCPCLPVPARVLKEELLAHSVCTRPALEPARLQRFACLCCCCQVVLLLLLQPVLFFSCLQPARPRM